MWGLILGFIVVASLMGSSLYLYNKERKALYLWFLFIGLFLFIMLVAIVIWQNLIEG